MSEHLLVARTRHKQPLSSILLLDSTAVTNTLCLANTAVFDDAVRVGLNQGAPGEKRSDVVILMPLLRDVT